MCDTVTTTIIYTNKKWKQPRNSKMKAFHPVTSGEIMISKEQPMNKFYNWLIRQNQNNFNNNKKKKTVWIIQVGGACGVLMNMQAFPTAWNHGHFSSAPVASAQQCENTSSPRGDRSLPLKCKHQKRAARILKHLNKDPEHLQLSPRLHKSLISFLTMTVTHCCPLPPPSPVFSFQLDLVTILKFPSKIF